MDKTLGVEFSEMTLRDNPVAEMAKPFALSSRMTKPTSVSCNRSTGCMGIIDRTLLGGNVPLAMTLRLWDHNPKLRRTDAAALDLGKFERSAYSQAIERLDQHCGVRPGID
jgi:hypothetical protein